MNDQSVLFLFSRAGLLELARYPNVYCKASGMFATNPKWDQESVKTVVKPLFEIFGSDRSVTVLSTVRLKMKFNGGGHL
jgi:predicted TIM-barrel fold metal-dependent hydrolase